MAHITIRLTDTEKAQIDANADLCCLSRSAYIRQVSLGYVPHTKVEHQYLHVLARLNADIGRIGGLLKLWLTRREDFIMHHQMGIHDVVVELVQLMNEINKVVEKL